MDMGTEQTRQPLSDEEIATRLAAETKQLTIEPVSEIAQTTTFSDAQIVAQHTSGPALANTSIDTEETRPTTTDTTERRTGGHILAISLTSAVLLAAAGAFYLLVAPR